MYHCFGITEKGRMSHNEDAIIINGVVSDCGKIEEQAESPFVAAVSDGVSSFRGGGLAARMCLEKLCGFMGGNLAEFIMNIHREIATFSSENEDIKNMQTTLCGIFIDKDDSVIAFNVGDSRLYRYQNGTISQLTRDQSLVQLMYEEGEITKEEMRTHVRRNIIFPVIGNIKDAPKVDIFKTESLQQGEIFLICTDGLSDYLTSSEISEILSGGGSPGEKAEMLVRKALENGSTDNVSLILVMS